MRVQSISLSRKFVTHPYRVILLESEETQRRREVYVTEIELSNAKFLEQAIRRELGSSYGDEEITIPPYIDLNFWRR